MNLLSTKDPNEKFPITFDFAEYLEGESITGTPTIAIEVYEGTDATPNNVLSGSVTVTGDRVKQTVQGGVAGAKYLIRATATTNLGRIYTLGAVLPVQKAGL
jgi:hypothetical protein